MNSKFLEAEWKNLAIANYAVHADLLLPYLPFKTELDTWNGKHYISLVGFRFINTRLKGVPVPFHRNFEEVNLRFYVRYKDGGNWKRGVTFIREIVPKRALSFVANRIYKEKYVTMPMKHHWQLNGDDLKVAYYWKCDHSWNSFSIVAEKQRTEIAAGSEEEFITEHYWGYTPLNNEKCSEYGVEHPRWKTHTVKNYNIDVDFGKIYHPEFSFLNSQIPDSVMLAEGSEIVVGSMKRIR